MDDMKIRIGEYEHTELEAMQLYMEYKNKENELKALRTEAEAALINHFGAVNTKVGRFKISFKKNYKYSLSEEGWVKIYGMPAELRPVKTELDVTKVKKINSLVEHLEVSENKPTVSVCYE